jgi:hypothetical protein
MSEPEPKLTLDQKRASIALLKALLLHKVEDAQVILTNTSAKEQMAVAVGMKLAAFIHPVDAQKMLEEADATLRSLASEED